ncbi:MAG: class I SAM-dependent methyltransferase [bacterium]
MARQRLQEEAVESNRVKMLQQDVNCIFAPRRRHFIIGAGTGGLAVVLAREYGCWVGGVEPDRRQLSIIRQKCRAAAINPANFKPEHGERLSATDNQFDFVHCFAVLEHVRHVGQCIDEMIRVLKPGGFIFINTPNYNYPYEGHYKVLAPTFLPKITTFIWLVLLGRNINLLSDINFLTLLKIDRLLLRKNVSWHRLYHSHAGLFPERTIRGAIVQFFLQQLTSKTGIHPQQEIIVRKL